MLPRWIEALERRFSEWAVPNLAVFVVAMTGLVWLLSLARPSFPDLLSLEPGLVLRGQAWRLVTFIFVPPAMGPVWILFWLYLLFIYAQALEREWGDFLFNLFYLLGAATLAAAALATGRASGNMGLNLTVFLAFAALYPDFELLLFFVLPAKVKWLAWLAWAGISLEFLRADLPGRLLIAASLSNYAIFFGPGHVRDAARLLKSWRDGDR